MAAFHLPPRQKMINLIYVVLLAMMAINVSSDVMKGFSVLNMNTDRQISELGVRHRLLWEQCKEVGDSAIVQKADSIRMLTASLCRLSASLREKIIRQADGEDYVRGRLVKAEDMKAVPYIMLAPTQRGGEDLRKEMERLRGFLFAALPDTAGRGLLATYLSTTSPSKYSWEREMFSTLPAVGGVLFLNQVEMNVLSGSNLVLAALLGTGAETPEETMAAGDTVWIWPHGMNIIYAGITNALDVHAQDGGRMDLKVSNGRAYKSKGRWYVSQAKVGKCVVEAKMDGVSCGRSVLRVLELPSPSASVVYKSRGTSLRYQGRTPIKKADFLKAEGLEAQYSDGHLNYTSRVIGFEMIFIASNGKVTTLDARGNRFTAGQLDKVRTCAPGEKFYISSIMVELPDGRKKEIEPMEVILI